MKRVLHIVRRDATTPAFAPDDWVVYLQPLRLTTGGEPGPITHDDLVALIFAADLVIAW